MKSAFRLTAAAAAFTLCITLVSRTAHAVPPTFVNLGTNRQVTGVYYDETNDLARLSGYNIATQRGIIITINSAGTVTETAVPNTEETEDISAFDHYRNGAYVAAYAPSAPYNGGIWNTASLTSPLAYLGGYDGFGIADNGLSVGLYSGYFPMAFSSVGSTLLPVPAGYIGEGIARDVSRDGLVIVGALSAPMGVDKAVVWNNGVPSMLNGVTPASLYTGAFAVSPWGNYIAGGALDISTNVETAVYWVNQGTITNLPVDGLVWGVTNQGLMVGSNFATDRGFIWWPGQASVKLFQTQYAGVLPTNYNVTEIKRVYSDGVNAHYAMNGTNNLGQVIGMYSRGADPRTPGTIFIEPNGCLVVIGTSGNDTITISGITGGIRVVRNGVTTGPYAGVTKIKVSGREGNDTINVQSSSARPTMIDGGPGVDILTSSPTQGGTLVGGPGNDDMYGSSGVETFFGGDNDDYIDTNNGADYVYCGAGNDEVDGGTGNEHIYGEAGDDYLKGSSGADFIDGGPDTDDLRGGSGDDFIIGGTGDDDNVRGNGDNDFLLGSTLNNTPAVIEQAFQAWINTNTSLAAKITAVNSQGIVPLNDGLTDQLRGDGDGDWFLKFSNDTTVGYSAFTDTLTNY